MQQDHQLAQSNDLETWTLGQIAVVLPGATAVFRAVGLDYCCGGQVTLRDAAAANALDLDKLIVELRTLDRKRVPSPADLDTKTLTETIVTRFHRVHSKEMPELIQLAERVEAVHKDHPAVPTGLAVLLQQMLGELTVHMQKEEIVLFPQLRNGAMMPLVFPINAMMAEHQEHGGHLETIMKLTADMTVPEDGCPTWRALYTGLAKFADDLVEHIHIENNILFPRFLTDDT
jgi:regulator of cell morphogenesis and NO signaling